MVRNIYILVLTLLLCSNLFGQDVSIPTRFSQEGTLFRNIDKSVNELTRPITDFKENQKCTVIAYLGNDNYKIQYKDWTGLVTIEDLVLNDEIEDLYFEFQDQERERRRKEEEERKKRIYQIVNKDKIEKEKRLKDSIAKVEEAERKRIAFEKEEARKRAEALKEQRRLDSIANVEEAERQRIAFEKE
ncbi:hypothetical protein [Seonamhaeicola marinus]|uniref:Uncharacterized protein n=1 Tax=Seonamhaeicola marinus TaxID=1912246 RepID=A0A5D0ISG7_9FLAO|nr:hypothetical protein [Seonamhaeicola marinus]TYA86813.1 hypothetical protein FUA24_04615 [Seonamhaeicola marinus]